MSSPQLSRRAGWAFQSELIREMESDDRMALAKRIDLADEFEDLSPSDQRVIRAAEQQLGPRP